ncbi:MAG: recombinase family protein [Rhizonema sp. NSF051]|nr:recombinase family protein [Rhizonema sp. NSF051]
MMSDSLWINGPSRSGKTERLVQQFCNWVNSEVSPRELLHTQNRGRNNRETILKQLYLHQTSPAVLVLAANDDNRRELANRIVTVTQGQYPIRGKTPLGFFQDEVILFWPLLIQSLKLKAQFPVRLRPETEQELATKLWRSQLEEEILVTNAQKSGEFAEESSNGGIRSPQATTVSEYRLVRRILDLLQLAAYSGTISEDIASILERGLGEEGSSLGLGELKPEFLASLLLDWRNWCLERGLLTYGIVTELYSQHLLSNPNYQQQLAKRYQAVLADDVQDYPAVARHLLESLLQGGAVGAFSYNPDSTVRLGLGGDPDYMSRLRLQCRVETLTQPSGRCLAETITAPMLELIAQPSLSSLPQSVQSIQTISRAQLLRKTAEVIAHAIKQGQVQPNEVAIIAPGLDAIARYTIMEILSKQNIRVESLNDQRPLISSPVIRGLLTMMALIYPGLGRLVDRDAVAEMLVVLSRGYAVFEVEEEEEASLEASPRPRVPSYSTIDPIRAGLIADYCFVPHPERPNLLPVTAFDRWDRLGYGATTAYAEILQWIDKQRSQQEMRLIPSPITLLDRAIQRFLWNGSNLPYNQLSALRELLETAQHYWEIDTRLRQTHSAYNQWETLVEADISQENRDVVNLSENLTSCSPQNTIAEFIQLLRRGTITANAYPVRSIGAVSKAVTLATIFQYRSSRQFHRWHFWLDAGSPLWAKGGAATLFGASLFLQERLGQPWTAEDEKLAEEQRLQRILADLLSRVSEQVYLCHSDLAVNGQEQLGSLLPLVNACVPSQE